MSITPKNKPSLVLMKKSWSDSKNLTKKNQIASFFQYSWPNSDKKKLEDQLDIF